MSRAAQNQAKSTFGQAQGVAGTTNSNANSIFNPLLKTYQDEATAPQGIGDVGLSAENTASQQSTGGSTAGAVGQNNLMAARTRNKGGFQIANNASAREGMEKSSSDAVNNIANNEKLKQLQQQEGISGEQGLYGQNLNATLSALGAQNNATGELNQAGQSGWLQNTLNILNTVSGMGTAAGGMGAKPFCWIAAELYGGWDDPRTKLVRSWLAEEFSKSRVGAAVLALYSHFGERVAAVVKRNMTVRAFFRWLFNQALKKAAAWRANA